jgi:hypothetical protein
MPVLKHHTIKKYETVEILLHAFISSALDDGVWPASRLGRFNIEKTGIH